MQQLFIGMIIVALGTIIGSFGAVLFKMAAKNSSGNPLSLLKNVGFYSGAILYGLSALIFVYGLKFGELSALYPVVALSYIWVSLLSIKLLGEKMNGYRWLGIFLILVAVVFVGIGG